MYRIFKNVKNALIDGLNGLIKNKITPNAYDLNDYLFMENKYYQSDELAEKDAKQLNIFKCIGGVVQTYDLRVNENWGDGAVFIDLSDACFVVNQLIYIISNELFKVIYKDTELLPKGKKLTTDELIKLRDIAKVWFFNNPDGLNEIWDNILKKYYFY